MNHEPERKDGKKKIRRAIFLFSLAFISLGIVFSAYLKKGKPERWSSDGDKSIVVMDGGLEFPFQDISEKTVGEFLISNKLTLTVGDSISPSEDEPLFSGTRIVIGRAHAMTVAVDGGEQILHTQAMSVGEALKESAISVDEDDIVKPGRETMAESGIRVIITRVQIEEQSVEKPVAFDKKVTEDAELSWRKVIVTQKGERGIDRLTYRVSKYDGKEVNRKLIGTERIKEPVTQITTQGTFVKVGKTHRGAASWYAFTGTMSAANPWLPIGSYVRVTNMENGENVIVRINDRGPTAPGRIIDLDKVAFQKIASLGSGVINIKMEEIVN